MDKKRVLAAVGDVHDVNCWSNIPYFFFRAGQRAGFFDEGLGLDLGRLRWHRIAWNALAPLRGERFGGFQYTGYGNACMARQFAWEGIGEVITHAQSFPPMEAMVRAGIAYSHYIDFPLPNLFDDYGIARTIGARTARNALAREREQYAAARFVIGMSPWAARQVEERCGTPAEKVRWVIPGANLPEELFTPAAPEDTVDAGEEGEPPDGRRRPLVIGFVGKEPMRKGLDRLVAGIRSLRARGFTARVRVIGPSQNLFPGEPVVEHLGFIDKRLQPARLVAALRQCHIGALPAYEEAFGIAALEYLRCGLPGLITRTGGLGDSLPEDCRILLEKDCTGEDIADVLEALLRNPESFARLRHNARSQTAFASWDRCVRDFQSLWAEPSDVMPLESCI